MRGFFKKIRFFISLTLSALSYFAAPVFSAQASFAYGADVSWLPQMEAQGVLFYNDAGVQEDCLQILKEHGVNSIRLRVWVNPSTDKCTGHCSKDETVAMAKRAAAMGFRILLDFHYSDSWADPGKQTKPDAWSGHSIGQLTTDVYSHTTDVLSAVIAAGVHPQWVQIGNETNNGMLWEDGKASKSFVNFASLITSGYNAVKAVDSTIKVIVHISNGYDNGLFRWMFDSLNAQNARFDIIGMSLYPTASNWNTLTGQCLSNMIDMAERYGKEVMIAEVGMASSAAQECNNMLIDLIAKVKSVPSGKGIGVFYWEPESYSWCNYSMGAWNANGRPTIALDAFLSSVGNMVDKSGSSPFLKPGQVTVSFDAKTSSISIGYRLQNESVVSIGIVDIFGREIGAKILQNMPAGMYKTMLHSGDLSPGVYFCRVKSGGKTEAMRFSLVR
jgi:arabinogalactan endo-1,4-beta-galactosidase